MAVYQRRQKEDNDWLDQLLKIVRLGLQGYGMYQGVKQTGQEREDRAAEAAAERRFRGEMAEGQAERARETADTALVGTLMGQGYRYDPTEARGYRPASSREFDPEAPSWDARLPEHTPDLSRVRPQGQVAMGAWTKPPEPGYPKQDAPHVPGSRFIGHDRYGVPQYRTAETTPERQPEVEVPGSMITGYDPATGKNIYRDLPQPGDNTWSIPDPETGEDMRVTSPTATAWQKEQLGLTDPDDEFYSDLGRKAMQGTYGYFGYRGEGDLSKEHYDTGVRIRAREVLPAGVADVFYSLETPEEFQAKLAKFQTHPEWADEYADLMNRIFAGQFPEAMFSE